MLFVMDDQMRIKIAITSNKKYYIILYQYCDPYACTSSACMCVLEILYNDKRNLT
jgi:hypothetical protein